MDTRETQSAIIQILKAYESKKQWKEKLKLANGQFDYLTKTLQLNTHPMVCTMCVGIYVWYIYKLYNVFDKCEYYLMYFFNIKCKFLVRSVLFNDGFTVYWPERKK